MIAIPDITTGAPAAPASRSRRTRASATDARPAQANGVPTLATRSEHASPSARAAAMSSGSVRAMLSMCQSNPGSDRRNCYTRTRWAQTAWNSAGLGANQPGGEMKPTIRTSDAGSGSRATLSRALPACPHG